MKRLKCSFSEILVACALAVSAVSFQALAANRVEVESASLYAGQTREIGVYLENDVAVKAIVVPLEVREVTPGSFHSLIVPEARVPGSRLDAGVAYGFFDESVYPAPDGSCPNPGYSTRNPSDFLSPDGVILARQSLFDPPAPIGSDFPVGIGVPSMSITFQANGIPGQFEIDTTCATPASHLSFVNTSNQGMLPDFTKGTITILACECLHQADFDDNGFHDAVDYAMCVDVVFFGFPDPPNPGCPGSRADLNCDGVTDVVDTAYFGDYIYFGGPPPCDPCVQ